jgi:hypothetical protein
MATKLREYAAAIGVDDSRCVSQAELIAETVVRMLRRPPALQTAEILEEVAKAVEHCATEFINVAPYLCLPLEIPQRR